MEQSTALREFIERSEKSRSFDFNKTRNHEAIGFISLRILYETIREKYYDIDGYFEKMFKLHQRKHLG